MKWLKVSLRDWIKCFATPFTQDQALVCGATCERVEPWRLNEPTPIADLRPFNFLVSRTPSILQHLIVMTWCDLSSLRLEEMDIPAAAFCR